MLLSYTVFKIIFWELFRFYHLFTQAGTECVCAVKLAEGNISKECIKWNQNQEAKPPLFAVHVLCSWKVQDGNCINLYSEGYKSAEGEIMMQFSWTHIKDSDILPCVLSQASSYIRHTTWHSSSHRAQLHLWLIHERPSWKSTKDCYKTGLAELEGEQISKLENLSQNLRTCIQCPAATVCAISLLLKS